MVKAFKFCHSLKAQLALKERSYKLALATLFVNVKLPLSCPDSAFFLLVQVIDDANWHGTGPC